MLFGGGSQGVAVSLNLLLWLWRWPILSKISWRGSAAFAGLVQRRVEQVFQTHFNLSGLAINDPSDTGFSASNPAVSHIE